MLKSNLNVFARVSQEIRSFLTTKQATALLKKHGLTESDAEATGDGADEAKESFLDNIDDTIRSKSTEAEYAAFRHNEAAFPFHLLDDEQRAALAIAKGEFRLKASQYPAEYLRLKR